VTADLRKTGSDVADELSGNGAYEFFAAFRHNELSYPRFYATLRNDEALQVAREVVDGDNPNWIAPEGGGMHRVVYNPVEDKRLNVVLVSVESLGAEFLGTFGNAEGLTPNLDQLAGESLSFTQVYATGNRTVRGMEALALSLPPTPGQSIVKRPNNEELFTLGSIFEDRGFDTAFIYGGYGYFDNLNYFFSNNDYRVVDRTALRRGHPLREHLGCGDEDLFTLALRRDGQVEKEGGRGAAVLHARDDHEQPSPVHVSVRAGIDIPSGPGARRGEVHRLRDRRFPADRAKRGTGSRTRSSSSPPTMAHRRAARRSPLAKYRIRSSSTRRRTCRRALRSPDVADRHRDRELLGLLRDGCHSSKFYGQDVLLASGRAPGSGARRQLPRRWDT
jgi:hypothetical protein